MKRALLSLVVVVRCVAQSTEAAPAFEVASIKRALPGPKGVWTNGSPDRIRMLNELPVYGLVDHAEKASEN